MVVSLVRYVVRQGYKPHEIAIITPYVGQLLLLRRLLARANIMLFLDERDVEEAEAKRDGDDSDSDDNANVLVGHSSATTLHRCVRLATVDNFQGECWLFLFSIVLQFYTLSRFCFHFLKHFETLLIFTRFIDFVFIF